VRYGSTGDGVVCLQDALRAEGFFDGASDGQFGDSTVAAVRQYQTERELFVDGVVGRESAIDLGIWPDEESLVVRTPPPAPGAVDLWGVKLSPVASAGDDAPPLPPNSGTGRRVVYDRAGQRAWAVAEDGQIIRSWLVSGSKYSNEQPGTHTVYSRSEMSTAWNGQAFLPLMIRYQETDIGHIGFHGIPVHVSDNSPYMTTEELGTRLSGGCQRQHNIDAQFMWGFATVGTKVVVT
jgi:lipoprotein-anchoring transpeptidase ErfK/SrfK